MSTGISTVGSNAWNASSLSGASSRMSPSQKMSKAFDQIDTSGSGTITKSQFEQAFSSLNMPSSVRSQGADAIFSKLDPSNSGSVSKQDFVSGLIDQMKAARGHHGTSSASTLGSTDPTQSSDPTASTNTVDFSQLLQSLVNGTSSTGSSNGTTSSTAASLAAGLGQILNVTI
ncbi:MAG: EF-hand domain-containing protein [Ancalomicrobiaceae bacterium]|nr:EF-hand domain-containing protein [Ancalomicrobiaceae bacterium]